MWILFKHYITVGKEKLIINDFEVLNVCLLICMCVCVCVCVCVYVNEVKLKNNMKKGAKYE